jgi:hypothetical protein
MNHKLINNSGDNEDANLPATHLTNKSNRRKTYKVSQPNSINSNKHNCGNCGDSSDITIIPDTNSSNDYPNDHPTDYPNDYEYDEYDDYNVCVKETNFGSSTLQKNDTVLQIEHFNQIEPPQQLFKTEHSIKTNNKSDRIIDINTNISLDSGDESDIESDELNLMFNNDFNRHQLENKLLNKSEQNKKRLKFQLER